VFDKILYFFPYPLKCCSAEDDVCCGTKMELSHPPKQLHRIKLMSLSYLETKGESERIEKYHTVRILQEIHGCKLITEYFKYINLLHLCKSDYT
jgi:hypothetical protein